jgi:hypothetical protein
VPPSLLRYADEQSVVGVAATFTAMANMGRPPDSFEGWGIVSASRFVGRANLALALRNFDAEGVWGVSPHLIPHFALHSPSGTISLALGLHGPNLGVGGGVHSTADGFLAALTWLAAGAVPGVWLILSGWSPELVPERRGGPPSSGECLALALALTPANGNSEGFPVVRLRNGAANRRANGPTDLAWFRDCLAGSAGPMPQPIAADSAGQFCVELVMTPTDLEGQV